MSDDNKLFDAQLLTPEGPLFEGDAQRVTLPGRNGSFQVLFNHAPIVSSLGIGQILIEEPGKPKTVYAVSGGFIEMNKNRLTILAEKAEEKSTIDPAEARTLRDSLKEKLKTIKQGREPVEIDLLIADNRLKVAEL
ncbi:MAG: ATP synthase F1 subunit epsilon [Balneolaceae bacterium]|nr:MAG: ATP synthase F1 subunit epsilon [Balneolaceae bacterium]